VAVEDLTIQLPRIDVPMADKTGAARKPALIIYDGGEIGGLHSLSSDVTVIGRTAGCDIVIPESRVSRRHAIIRRVALGGDQFEVVDLGSTNGTFVDGDRVGQVVLQRGSKVAIGGRVLKFEMVDKTDIAYQSRIVQMIHLDELTGLLTKRSLFRALENELIRTERYHHPLSVLMMDLDHFKLVNDTHGHLVGSHCLSEVGALIREATRVTDVSGRYGGEEFVSFLPETDSAAALLVAERIRETLAGRGFQYHETHYQVRISIGISTYPEHGTKLETLVEAADAALYRAKEGGRNRCVVAVADQ
jgi:two-component system, cell cycle response regulator